MATATKPQSKTQQPETPFKTRPWPWNYVPQGGFPTRKRCQALATPQERDSAAKLLVEYRKQEKIARDNDIESRQAGLWLLKGIPAELMKREIDGCDYGKWSQAQARLAELRKEASAMAEPLFKRLIKNLDAELNNVAIAAESRLELTGIPIKQGEEWTLHQDVTCKALWSCREIAQKTRIEVGQIGDGIGSVQFFLTEEEGVPFQWLN